MGGNEEILMIWGENPKYFFFIFYYFLLLSFGIPKEVLIRCRAVVAPVQVVELGHDGIVRVAHYQDPAAGELLLNEAGGGVVGLLNDGGAVPPVPHLAPVPAQLQLQVLVYRTCTCWG